MPKLSYVYVTGFIKKIIRSLRMHFLKFDKICCAYQTGMKIATIVALLHISLSVQEISHTYVY